MEYGTKLHISVHFFSCCGNAKTQLPFSQKIHQCPVCDSAKSTPERFAACFRCRNTVPEWTIRHKKSFGGFCAKGVYEYCRPVVLMENTKSYIEENLLYDFSMADIAAVLSYNKKSTVKMFSSQCFSTP